MRRLVNNAWCIIFAFIMLAVVMMAWAGGAFASTHINAVDRSWMIGSSWLKSMQAMAPDQAAKFFDRNNGRVFNSAVPSFASAPVVIFHSFADYEAASPTAHWVLYDPESWSATPLDERNNPNWYTRKFITLAHSRGQQVIVTPGRDLVSVQTAVCHRRLWENETVSAAYLRCGYAKTAGEYGADVYEIQAQALQSSGATTFAGFVKNAAAQARAAHAGQVVWVGLTTDRHDTAWRIGSCYHAAIQATKVDGWWLNTNAGTLPVAVQFLRQI